MYPTVSYVNNRGLMDVHVDLFPLTTLTKALRNHTFTPDFEVINGYPK